MLERRLLDHGIAVLVDPQLETQGFMVAFTERSGGVSEDPFRGLNLGLKSGDDPELVKVNRRRLIGALDIPPFVSPRQVHSANVASVGPGDAGRGFDDPTRGVATTDGLMTSTPGVSISVLAADCVPLALVDPRRGAVAVIHAGWRGVAAGMIQSAVGAFPEAAEVHALVGPAVGPDHYEVGEDVAAAVSAGSEGGAVIRPDPKRLLLDLPATVARSLRNLGVWHVVEATVCTSCEPDRFFSHRRDGRTGRQGLVAVRRR